MTYARGVEKYRIPHDGQPARRAGPNCLCEAGRELVSSATAYSHPKVSDMKWFFRMFFRTLRLILGPILLAMEWLATPRGLQRSADEQRAIDEQTRNLTLYQFQTCPFCIKTRRAIKQLSLNIELRDAQKDLQSRQELLEGGGEIKVPCLRIRDDGSTEWLYESDDIIAYLNNRFDAPEKAAGANSYH